jgi:hypothetical protein
MLQSERLVVGFLIASLAGWGAESAAEITVQVHNDAGLPEHKVSLALAEAAWIMRLAGVTVHWTRCTGAVDCQESPDPRLLVISINADAPSDLSKTALGFALPFTARGNHAAAFVGKVASFTQNHLLGASEDPSVLGAVIAHELGHLLLKSNEHGDGIMRADWQSGAARAIVQRRLVFTPVQARNMRQNLQRRVASFYKRQQLSERASTR